MRALLDLVLPTPCAGCGRPDEPWCAACRALVGPPVAVHPPSAPPDLPVRALARYRGPVRAALLAHKERGRRDLAGPLGEHLAAALAALPAARDPAGRCWLVPVPSRRAAAARRGGQHVAVLAARAAAGLAAAGVPAAVAPALRLTRGAADSVGLDPAARRANLAGRVLLRRAGAPPPGTPVVLLDDVVTTGATAAECAGVLARAGLAVRAVLVVAAA